MICRNCGIEIAEKALICYRCGIATTEPKFKPPVASPRTSSFVVLLMLVIVLAASLALATLGGEIVPHVVSWAVAAVSGLLLAWRIVTDRRS